MSGEFPSPGLGLGILTGGNLIGGNFPSTEVNYGDCNSRHKVLNP